MKIIEIIAVVVLTLASVTASYADTTVVKTQETPTTTTIQTQKPAVITVTDTAQPPPQETTIKVEKESNSPVYDSIRSGWNKFIDVLAGPKK